ncbi:hypothetical protein [Solibacillus sp. FSL K6-1523]|uniref:hypothetical protein n=1 Tax=Solibacillus sp. FSL K6-1523 TaxID=2921471 RepID=UPI0030F5FF74
MEKSVKEYLLRKFPPTVKSLEVAYESSGLSDHVDIDKAQELSDKIIAMFKEEDMTYTDAYAILGFIHMDLSYRSERVNL